MEFFWHPEAVSEADAAADFYHNKQRELARRFINHLDEALDRIAIKPGIYREVAAGIRKIKLKTFPYAVIYRINDVKRDHRGHAHTSAPRLLERPRVSKLAHRWPSVRTAPVWRKKWKEYFQAASR